MRNHTRRLRSSTNILANTAELRCRIATGTKLSRPHAGFTLVELLVVIVIISIVATFGALSIKVNTNKQLETLTSQLVNTLTLAQQEALLRPATLGLAVNPNHLTFYLYQPATDPEKSPWQSLGKSILNITTIPHDTELTLKIDGENQTGNTPHVIISPSGDLTAFTLFIGKKNSPPRYKITGEDNGNITSGAVNEEN